jgi:hypothetical protein
LHNVVSLRPRVVGPYGNPLTIDTLPKGTNIRWVRRRKQELVLAVRHRVITLEDACSRYALSPEEFAAWTREFDRTVGAPSDGAGHSTDLSRQDVR